MRRFILVIGCALALLPAAARADIACNATTPLKDQKRTKMKHRQPAADSVPADQTTVAGMRAFSSPPHMDVSSIRDKDEVLSPLEEKVFRLEGNLWRIKVEDNDCDFHLEISEAGTGKKTARIIAELSQGLPFVEARDTLIQAVKGVKPKVKLKSGSKIDMKTPIRIRVTGFAFYDSFHFSKKHPQKGVNHGGKSVATLWEIHPVWRVEILGSQ